MKSKTNRNNGKNRNHISVAAKIDKKIKNQVSIEYYQQKITFLNSRSLHPALVMLACRDAPVRSEDVSSQKKLRRHIKKCIKYYEKKLTDLRRNRKSFFRSGIMSKFFPEAI